MHVTDLGWRAHRALEAAGGRARVVAALSTSVYLEADDTLLWLGRTGSALHGRAVLTSGTAPAAAAGTLSLDVAGAGVWAPAEVGALRWDTLRAIGRALCDAVPALGAPRGFGALLAGQRPAFPLAAAADTARALAGALAGDDAAAAADAAVALVGLGPGLTPAGDDFVGAAFFAHALAGRGGDPAWQRAVDRVCARARTHTHPVSATLLADLCAGAGHAPLHELAALAATVGPPAALVDVARRLTRLGHSSGWDMLAGFVAGSGSLPRV
jgi:hypothetical protein